MFHGKLMHEQIQKEGVRIGDDCSISPSHGRKRVFALNRHCVDIVSSHVRPPGLSVGYIELAYYGSGKLHYRLELDEKTRTSGRFVLKALGDKPFWINGIAAREAYVERNDRIYIEDHRINFKAAVKEGEQNFDHPLLTMGHLMESDLKILMIGETGSGKTHLARKIHERSGKRGPFVAVNLSSFNAMLIESELFGHKKGSFTGALQDRQGAFAMAEHGTLFLDEIDSLPVELQTKLLTFLDSKLYRRVGDATEKEIRTRLIFASGRSLEGLVQQGRFRKDFYYRLKSGHTVILPSLRNGPKLIQEACSHYARTNGIVLSQRLLEFYQTLPWPGNLRQIFGHLDKKKVMSRSAKIDFDQVDEELLLQSSDLMSLSDPLDFQMTMEECKLNHLRRTLAACEGDTGLAAKRLRLSEKTIKKLILKAS